MPQKKKRPTKAPENATMWMLEHHYKDEGGKNRRVKKKGPPQPDGSVLDQFPVHEFSPAKVLEVWGPGRYRVDFYDAIGEHIPESGRVFEVGNPVVAGPDLQSPTRGRPSKARRPATTASGASEDDEPEPEPVRRTGDTISIFELIMMQKEDRKEAERREERLAERHRQDAIAAVERDRQFMGTILATLTQRPAQSSSTADDMALMRREMRLTIREGLSEIRGQQSEDEPDELDDPDDPPADIGEAGTRIGMRLLRELEGKAPELLNGAIPVIADYLKSKGFKPSDELENALAGRTVNGRANGG